MTLTRESWLPRALALRDGQSIRVEHDCGDGRVLKLSRDAEGYRAWCFRCNEGDRAPPPHESTAEKVARLARQAEADAAVLRPELPEPRVYRVDDWPPGARLWLYQAGLGRAEIGALGVYYHPPTDRVVLPVLEAGELVFWQARAWQKGRQPKYLAPSADKSSLIARWGRAESATLTEDILSAVKVGLSGGEGWAVMGTNVNTRAVAELLRRGVPVNVWFDPDPAGQRGALKLIKQLRAYGLAVRNILSARDPKLHTRAQVMEYLTT